MNISNSTIQDIQYWNLTLKQTQSEKGRVRTTRPQENMVRNHPHNPIPSSLSSAEHVTRFHDYFYIIVVFDGPQLHHSWFKYFHYDRSQFSVKNAELKQIFDIFDMLPGNRPLSYYRLVYLHVHVSSGLKSIVNTVSVLVGKM
jgi:hypothetical protein